MSDYAHENQQRLIERLRYLHPEDAPVVCNVGYADLLLEKLRVWHPEGPRYDLAKELTPPDKPKPGKQY